MYRLTRGAEKLPTPPALDPSQRAVVEHPGGPLLVLAGPGTGRPQRWSNVWWTGSNAAATRPTASWC